MVRPFPTHYSIRHLLSGGIVPSTSILCIRPEMGCVAIVARAVAQTPCLPISLPSSSICAT
eukprot:11887480-Prorocentrum_lima.AAC.1